MNKSKNGYIESMICTALDQATCLGSWWLKTSSWLPFKKCNTYWDAL